MYIDSKVLPVLGIKCDGCTRPRGTHGDGDVVQGLLAHAAGPPELDAHHGQHQGHLLESVPGHSVSLNPEP